MESEASVVVFVCPQSFDSSRWYFFLADGTFEYGNGGIECIFIEEVVCRGLGFCHGL